MNSSDKNELNREVIESQREGAKGFVFESNRLQLPEMEGDIVSEYFENDSYQMRKRLLGYLNALGKMQDNNDLQELAKNAAIWLKKSYNVLYKNMQSDIDELDRCFRAKEYKATLILAGSILEGFLLDWLSEIDGKNYFVVPYTTIHSNSKGNKYVRNEESLCAYIDRINDIERPEWMECCEKAHYIRKNRNTVHAKIGLKKENEINEKTCKKVISYLNEIIDTRISKQQKMLDEVLTEQRSR